MKLFLIRDVRVGLIHYNDSKCEKGKKKDRHANIGSGKIGLGPLLDFAEFAVRKGLLLLRE